MTTVSDDWPVAPPHANSHGLTALVRSIRAGKRVEKHDRRPSRNASMIFGFYPLFEFYDRNSGGSNALAGDTPSAETVTSVPSNVLNLNSPREP